MTCANVLVGLGKIVKGWRSGDVGREDGDAAICVAPRRERRSMLTALVAMLKISIHAPAKGATAIFHKIINLYCKTSTNTTRINSLNINKKYINRIKARILNYFFGANHLINLCKLYIRTCNL